MKKNLVFLFSIFVSCNMLAQKKLLHIVSKGDKYTVIGLDKSPVLKISGNHLYVVTNERDSVAFPLSDLKTYYFTVDSSTSIERIVDNGKLRIYIDGDHIKVYCGNAKSKLTVYDVNGRIAYVSMADARGLVSIKKDELGTGVYVFKVDNSSIKYIVK